MLYFRKKIKCRPNTFKIARDLKNQTDPTFKFLDHYSISPDLANNIINKVLLRWCNGTESTCQCRGCGRHGFNSWVGKIPWRKWQPMTVHIHPDD